MATKIRITDKQCDWGFADVPGYAVKLATEPLGVQFMECSTPYGPLLGPDELEYLIAWLTAKRRDLMEGE